MFKIFGIAGIILSLSLIASAAEAQPTVTLTSGTIEGLRKERVEAFLGIPYAAPPTGHNRWRPPQPVRAWQGVRKADHFGANCWQVLSDPSVGRPPWTPEYMAQGPISEDCLYLNVWAPAGARQRVPVLVWIHGGGFVEGSGSVPVYDGANLAARGVIVVTINYRVGVLGFFAHPELTRESHGEPAANFGLQDQIAALKWIRENIAAFGGDPDAVTIAGQSAGALCVHALVASPLTAGLFRGAIAESGPPNLFPVPTLKQAEDAGLAFAKAKGVRGIAELRALPAESVGTVPPGVAPSYAPVADGILLPEPPQAAIAAGRFRDVPMIVGQVADEMSFAPGYAPASQDAFNRTFAQYGAFAERFQATYPAVTDAERVEAGRLMGQDRGLWSLLLWCKDRLTKGSAPVYAYMFNHIQPGPDADRFQVFHTSEVPYIFANLDAPKRKFTERDQRVSDIISGFWLNFVKSGNPNGGDLAAWPRMEVNNPQILVIGDEVSPTPMLDVQKRALFGEYSAAGGILSAF